MKRGPKLPRCPRHPDSRVWRDGSYATRRGIRQRYRCVPLGNARPHRFVAPDPQTPHGFSYTAREIAAALVEVGRGASYRTAASHARERADAAESTDGNTVAGWVESFAPTGVWSAPEGGARFGISPRWSFFQVVQPQDGARLFVKVADTGNVAYVDAKDVGPSGPPK